MAVPKKSKLEAIAYLIAGLSLHDAARRADVSYSSLCRWDRDKKLRAEARSIYMKAISDARAHHAPKTRLQVAEDKQKVKIASIMSRMDPASRTALARKGAAAALAAGGRKPRPEKVIVNQHPIKIVPVVVANDEEDMKTKLKELAKRFNTR